MRLSGQPAVGDMQSQAPLPGIVIQGVRKRFGPVVALQHVDLVVNRQEIVALLGPNGAGKSTLLRILSTIILPDQGQALISGIDVSKDPRAAQKRLGTSFGEDRAWYWRLSGRQNLEFFAALYGLDRRSGQERINILLDDFHLATVADRPLGTYSSGMKARFSLMRALLPSPRVLLLDEPTRSLDPIAANDFREQIMKLRQTADIAILLTTHDLYEAAAMADRISVLVKGQIVTTVDHGIKAEELQLLLVDTVKAWTS
jgi:ABC-2 type transport system ATP-binding protein